MKTFILGCLAIIMAQTVLAQTVINDPNVEVRSVGSFTAIRVSHAIDLYLSQSDEEAVAVSARTTEFRDMIRTTVENGVLRITYEESKVWRNTPNKRLRAYVSFKTLNKLTASGASDVHINGTIRADGLSINMSGASDLKGSLDVNELEIDISGASDMTVTGRAAYLRIEASGASDFKGFDFQTENCMATASGASDIKVTVNKELNARASGASGVQFKGEGVIRDLKTSGASSVSRKS